jgi:hypothetical protein
MHCWAGRQFQRLKAEDNAGTALLYMRFEIVINPGRTTGPSYENPL